MAEKRGRYHADPLLARYGMLKVGDLYRQQLRVHAWRFQNGLLPRSQAAMLTRAADLHGHNTRSATRGLAVTARDHRMLGYWVPKEWATLTEDQRGVGSLTAFKRGSRAGFLAEYAAFVCADAGFVMSRRGEYRWCCWGVWAVWAPGAGLDLFVMLGPLRLGNSASLLSALCILDA